ncbi:MAG: transcription elongation factor GreA [Myxococcota bacterium]|jgi:transcription elongation factor GreA
MERAPMTPRGNEKLKAMLKHLKEVERPAIVLAIEVAREHGDLKENAEYHTAKDKQGMIVAQISHYADRLGRAQVIDPSTITMERIAFGATITVLIMDDDEEVTYQIVGSEEADVKDGRISYDAPLARAMMGKEEGDIVRFKAPKGMRRYEILEIEYK